MRIQLEDIKKNMIIDEDVFGEQGNLIVGRGFSVSNTMILKNLLRQNKVDKVKVLTLSEEIEVQSTKEKIAKEIEDFKMEFQDTVSVIESELSNILSGELEPEKLNSIVETSLSMQSGSTLNIFQMMQKVKDSDDVIYAHCYSVSLSAYVIGSWLKLSESELSELTMAAILADAGKVSVPKEILMKKESLTNEDMAQIKKHVQYSYDMVEEQPVSDKVKEAILYHHEREDGSGYPEGIKGDEIPYYAKIVAIADVYTALTSKRPQRGKLTPFEALKIMERDFMNKLDVTILTEFLKRIAGNYIGNPVKLSDGSMGEIVFLSVHKLSRPVIRLTEGDKIIDLGAKENAHIDIVEFL